MPIRTRPTPKEPSAPGRPASAWSPSRLLAAGAVYGAAELGIGLLFGFFSLGRAEALLFYAFRPWLLLVAALLVSRRPLGERLTFYAAALLLAARRVELVERAHDTRS